MSEKIQQSGEQSEEVVITLDETFDITCAAQYHERFNQLLNSHKSIILDASKVSRADGCALQLVLAFLKEAKELDVSVNWHGASDAFKASADILSMTELLGLK